MSKNVTVVGAGLVGSLLSIALQRKGISVTLLEKRSDPRKVDLYQGRSINLALSQRGILALEAAGIMEEVRPLCTPMFGRLMHGLQGEKSSQPYGKKNQCINSISRNGLNQLLLDQAEKAGVSFQFGKKCESVDPNTTSLVLEGGKKIQSDLIIGTDGAYSMVRKSIQNIGRFDFSQSYIDHGYKEIEIPAKDGAFALEPDHCRIAKSQIFRCSGWIF
ncbi:MAG: NAD(P)/FAD-dependent oxidoreductase [Bacteroidota bacterium]